MPYNEVSDAFEPAVVYKRTDSKGLNYWTTKEAINLESQLKKLEHLKKIDPDLYTMNAEALKAHQERQETASSLDELAAMVEFVDYYGPLVSQTKEAQKELTMKFLLDGTDFQEIKTALGTGTSWLTVQSWAAKFSGVGTEKKFVRWLIPEALGRKINELVAVAAAEKLKNKTNAA